jgi:hypothetical protein
MDIEWRRSSACANGNCVEVAYELERVFVKDSHGTTIELREDVWVDLIGSISDGADNPEPKWIAILPNSVRWFGVPTHRGDESVALRYTLAEWDEFLAAARRGEFDVEVLSR